MSETARAGDQPLPFAFHRLAITAIRPVAIAPRTYVEGSGTMVENARKRGIAAPVLQVNSRAPEEFYLEIVLLPTFAA